MTSSVGREAGNHRGQRRRAAADFHLPAEWSPAARQRRPCHRPGPRRRHLAARRRRTAPRARPGGRAAAAHDLRPVRPDQGDLGRGGVPARRQRRPRPVHPAHRRDPRLVPLRPAHPGRHGRRRGHYPARRRPQGLGRDRPRTRPRPEPPRPQPAHRAVAGMPPAVRARPARRAADQPARDGAGRPRHRHRDAAPGQAEPARGRARRRRAGRPARGDAGAGPDPAARQPRDRALGRRGRGDAARRRRRPARRDAPRAARTAPRGDAVDAGGRPAPPAPLRQVLGRRPDDLAAAGVLARCGRSRGARPGARPAPARDGGRPGIRLRAADAHPDRPLPGHRRVPATAAPSAVGANRRLHRGPVVRQARSAGAGAGGPARRLQPHRRRGLRRRRATGRRGDRRRRD